MLNMMRSARIFPPAARRWTSRYPIFAVFGAEPVLSFEGRFHKLDRANIIPRPKRQIPIFCGGFGEAPYRRAAEMADGFIFAAGLDEQGLPGMSRIKELLVEKERSVDSFGFHLLLQDKGGRGLDVPDTIDTLHRWRDAGGTHASVGTMYRGYKSPQEHIDFLVEVKQRLDA